MLINKEKQLIIKRILLSQLAEKQSPISFFVPQDYQIPFFNSNKKDIGIFGGNRSGKTLCSAGYIIKFCLAHPNSDCWAATWADMSVSVQQSVYYKLLPKLKSKVIYANFSEQRGFANRIILFANGSKIRFKTYEQGRESFQGTAKHNIHLDEEAPVDIVNECKARLIDYNGRMIRSMTPLNGITYTYYEFILNENNNPEIEYWFWDTTDNKYLNEEARERVLNSYAPKEAAVRRTGTFKSITTGIVYYAFNRGLHLKEKEYNKDKDLNVCVDFNVSPCKWAIIQNYDTIDYVINEIIKYDTNTIEMAKCLLSIYPQITRQFIFYGDYSGTFRHTSSPVTDYDLIKKIIPNVKIFTSPNPLVVNRINILNSRLLTADNKVHLFVDPKCKHTIKDFEFVEWQENTKEMNKKNNELTHISDAIGYYTYVKYPMKKIEIQHNFN